MSFQKEFFDQLAVAIVYTGKENRRALDGLIQKIHVSKTLGTFKNRTQEFEQAMSELLLKIFEDSY